MSTPLPTTSTPLPDIDPKETADEEKFDCPQPWYLALLAVAMSIMTTMTVAGSLFFVLAAPEKVSPRCREFGDESLGEGILEGMCTFSVICFWTYPVVCCLFVVLLFAKNLVDQRVYYEFLLHKVLIGFDRANPFAYPVVIALLVYAICAFSALIWLHVSNPSAVLNSVYSSLAYISPIISFLAVVLAQWSIQGKLITLPNFLEDYEWGVQHLNVSKSYYVETVHAGYIRAEKALDKSNTSSISTPQMIALVEHFTKEVVAEAAAEEKAAEERAKNESAKETSAPQGDAATENEKGTFSLRESAGALANTVTNVGKGVGQGLGSVAGKVKGAVITKEHEYVYWQWRMLFNPRLQDERSQNFRNWALGYFISVVLAILLSVYVFMCLFITCLEIEKILEPGTSTWAWTHSFSLRPDLDHGDTVVKSLKQVAAKAVVSVMNDGARALRRGSSVLSQFQLGVAA